MASHASNSREAHGAGAAPPASGRLNPGANAPWLAAVPQVQASAPFRLALLLLALAAIQLFAWQFDLEVLRRPLRAFPAIYPWTVLGFFGIALTSLLLAAPEGRGCQTVARGLALLIASAASFFLLEHLRAQPVGGFDQLLFKPLLFKAGGSFPGRPTSPTCVTFALLSLAVWTFDRQDRRRIEAFQLVVALALFLPALAVLGYALSATVSLGQGGTPTTEMAAPTLLMFCLSGAAFFSFFPKEGWVGLVLENGLAGQTLRRLLPVAALVPLASGWALYYVTLHWRWPPQLTIALYVLVPMALLTALSFEIGRLIRRHEADQRAATIERERQASERERQLELQASLLAQLTRANSALEEFASVASHDLQEPLRSMKGCAQLMGRKYAGKLDHEADELIAFMVDGASRMKSLIEDLLAFSQAGRLATLETVDAKEALQEALVRLSSALREAEAEVACENLPALRFGKGQLVQVFQNLVGNAVKYRTDRAPRVRVSGRRQGRGWLLSVADNGIGFEAQHADQVFGAFTRLHTREAFPGTGLGLAIVRKTVEQRGGKIWAESRVGEGTTFTFSVPDQEPGGAPGA